MKKLHILLLLLFSLIACAPLLYPGFYTSHDGGLHLIRLFFFSKELLFGHFLPGWLEELNNFQGYPLFTFVYPLPYYLGSLWHAFGFSIIDSLKTIFFLSTTISVIFFYLWLSTISTSTKAFIASIIYLFTPYRFINLYVRAALGEVVFLGLIPVAFYLIEKRKYYSLTIVISLLLLSHLQLSSVFIPILFVYSLLRRLSVIRNITSIIAGFCLAAFFWIPATTLINQTLFLESNQYSPALHLPTLKQLLYSPWGFGFSKPGPIDGMSFQLGLVNIAVLVLSILLFFKSPIILKYFSILAILIIVLMAFSPFGFWTWPVTQSVQFSWRLLSITSFILPALLALLPFSNRLLFVVLASASIYVNRNHIRLNQVEYVNAPDSYFYQPWKTTTATPNEFMPIIFDSTTKYKFTSAPIIHYSRMLSLSTLVCILLLKLRHARVFSKHSVSRQRKPII